MYVLSAICCVCIGRFNENISWKFPFVLQCLCGGLLITIGEFVVGMICNVWLGMNIWDYSHMRWNLYGVICPQFSLIWCALSGVVIVVDDYLKYWFFNDDKPKYKLL